jgi:dipeptidyl aminopeptidase/acylaminoacyl peptidase
MKIKTLAFLITIGLSYGLNAQDIQGDWNGELNVQGQEMTLVFHFTKENNEYNGTMDIPTQGATGIPIEEITLNKNELSLSLMNGSIVYQGTLKSELINGIFKQNGKEFTLNLNKGDMKKAGNVTLPSSKNELEALAAKETGSYKYEVKDYFAKPTSSSFKLSPNGSYMSFRKKDNNLKNHVYVKNISSGEEKRIIVEDEELIRGYGWANDDRLIYVMDKGGNEDYHLFAVNVDGSNQKELTPYDGVKVEIIQGLKEDKNHMIITMNKNNPQVFDPYKINIKTGEIEQLYENKDVQNPIMNFVFDKDGNLRAYAKLKDGIKYELFYKMDNNNFELMHETNWDESFSIQKFNYASENKHEAYVISNLETDKTEIFRYDLAQQKPIENLFSHDKYDVSGLGISRNRNWELDYFSYEGDKYHIIPISDYFKKLYSRLSEEFENYDFYISDKTDDENQYLIYVTSDKLYGKYYLYDVKKDKINLLFDLMPQLDENDMSTMQSIKFKSRDGLTIHGYITLPKSAKEGEKVPVVVNPHGGPQGIRDSWGFNPEAQLFASRGYATLHVNFRISGGYGKEFLRKGFKEIGRKAMDDVEDGLKYIIEQGWVDAEKVAIYGASHGGYAVLRGLTKTPNLYTCGIDYVGVSNLYTFMESMPTYWKPYLDIIKAIWYDENIQEEKKIMDEVSPAFHIDKITKPLFVIQGANDPRVNIDESDQIVSGLRAKGVNVPYMVKYDEGHGFAKEENRMALYSAMMGFLAENLKD